MTDLVAQRQFENSRTYSELFRPLDARYQVTIMTGRPGDNRGSCWALTRTHRDFSEYEVELASALQPSLALVDTAYASRLRPYASEIGGDGAAETGVAHPRGRDLGITPREAQVLELLAQGATAQQMATHCASASVPYASTSNMCTADSTPMIGYRRCRGPDPSVCWRLNAASSRDRSPCLAGGLRRDDRVPGRACRVDELRREGLNPTDTQSPGVDQSRSTPRSASRSSTSR